MIIWKNVYNNSRKVLFLVFFFLNCKTTDRRNKSCWLSNDHGQRRFWSDTKWEKIGEKTISFFNIKLRKYFRNNYEYKILLCYMKRCFFGFFSRNYQNSDGNPLTQQSLKGLHITFRKSVPGVSDRAFRILFGFFVCPPKNDLNLDFRLNFGVCYSVTVERKWGSGSKVGEGRWDSMLPFWCAFLALKTKISGRIIEYVCFVVYWNMLEWDAEYKRGCSWKKKETINKVYKSLFY